MPIGMPLNLNLGAARMPQIDRRLLAAAGAGRSLQCKNLIDAGANPRSSNSYTPLMAAAENGKVRCVEVLAPLSNVLAIDERQMNAAMLAIKCASSKNKCHQMLRMLFAELTEEEKEACCAQRSAKDECALYFAIHMDCQECAKILAPYSDTRITGPESERAREKAARCFDFDLFGILKSREARLRAAKQKTLLEGEVPFPRSMGDERETKRL